MSITFGSLFAGIGGFDLGFERAGMTCKWQVEIDPFCQRVLAKHWPNVRRHDDVRTFPQEPIGDWRVDVICGGFPCQDISNAGTKLGLDGERSGLWTEYQRIIRVLEPKFVVVENSAALLYRGLGRILADLSGMRFDAVWNTTSSCAFGAAHMRRRLFIVAYSNSLNGRERVRDSIARQDRSLQAIDGTPRARPRYSARLENPSQLYRGAHGIPNGPHRNRAIGNSVFPDIAEWIGRRIVNVMEGTT